MVDPMPGGKGAGITKTIQLFRGGSLKSHSLLLEFGGDDRHRFRRVWEQLHPQGELGSHLDILPLKIHGPFADPVERGLLGLIGFPEKLSHTGLAHLRVIQDHGGVALFPIADIALWIHLH